MTTRKSSLRTLAVLALLCTLLAPGASPAHAETTLVVNSTGNAGDHTFSMAPLGGFVTATATNRATGDISEFSVGL